MTKRKPKNEQLMTIIDFAKLVWTHHWLTEKQVKEILYEYSEAMQNAILEWKTVRINWLCTISTELCTGERFHPVFKKKYSYEEYKIKSLISREFKNSFREFGVKPLSTNENTDD